MMDPALLPAQKKLKKVSPRGVGTPELRDPETQVGPWCAAVGLIRTVDDVSGPMMQFLCDVIGSTCWVLAVVAAKAAGANPVAQAAAPVKTVATLKAFLIRFLLERSCSLRL